VRSIRDHIRQGRDLLRDLCEFWGLPEPYESWSGLDCHRYLERDILEDFGQRLAVGDKTVEEEIDDTDELKKLKEMFRTEKSQLLQMEEGKGKLEEQHLFSVLLNLKGDLLETNSEAVRWNFAQGGHQRPY
jgi:hypothetical protein